MHGVAPGVVASEIAPAQLFARASLVDSEVLVHVGLPKTGTTWLQDHVFANNALGFWGPAQHEDTPKQQTKAFGRLLYLDANKRLIAEDDFDSAALRDQLEGIMVPEGLVPVVSNERLSGHPLSNAFDRATLARRIKDVFPHARIFVTIREQRSMILSSYFQYLKYGGWRSLDGFLNPPCDGRLPALQLDVWSYGRLAQLYYTLFGRERVLILPYEMFVRDPAGYVSRICEFAGVSKAEKLPYETKSNPRRAHVASYYLRWLTCINRSTSANGYFPHPFGRRIGKAIDRSVKTAVGAVTPASWEKKLENDFKARIERITGDRYRASNRRLVALTGLDLGSYGY
ncbi:MAG: sulfotransferase, partial [Rhizobiales bacterium]|nr:sulfotransferase [Hyphomicrobiales bacterium]